MVTKEQKEKVEKEYNKYKVLVSVFVSVRSRLRGTAATVLYC